ncbi:MAG TPA: VacJ family lipoprotein [Burkholderiaceae bacterium]|nr:VacJ family lipoprotein [Burkholderiaceae bacterium]
MARCGRMTCALVAFVLMSGCATGPTANPRDPLEPLNRNVSQFNEVVDSAFLKPVATVYKRVTPPLVRTGVSNFFANLGDLWSAANNLLQLKVQAAAETFMRFNVNTFFGLAGILDVAGEMGIERHKEDFGQTLGRWGVPAGPYLVLPLLGPSTLRDAAVMPLEARGNLLSGIENQAAQNSLYVLKAVDARSNLLRASSVLDEAALDKYSFTRDAYLQLRRAEVYDGEDPDDGKEPKEPKEAEPPAK